MTIVIDETHLGRRASGIERVTQALFSKAALAPLDVQAEQPRRGKLGLFLKQMLAMPTAAALTPGSVWIFPGFPPSPGFALLRRRAVLYVHDTFLITRRHDLNLAAKYWMAPNFRIALRQFRYFMANSATTADALRRFVRPEAEILLYRPGAENVFRLKPAADAAPRREGPLIVGAIGTVEPRKNFPKAAEICEKLARMIGRPVELHFIGRRGWGGDYEALAAMPHVKLHGFLPDEAARQVIQSFDMLICVSHDEGLCLPLLEAQFAGLQIIAPDQAVFREVLGGSGLYIDVDDASASAGAITALVREPGWRGAASAKAAGNIRRWNETAAGDRIRAVSFLSELAREAADGR